MIPFLKFDADGCSFGIFFVFTCVSGHIFGFKISYLI